MSCEYQQLPTDEAARAAGYRYDEAKAAKVRNFLTGYCRLSRPPHRGPVVLMPWQQKYINALFGWVNADGERRFTRSGLWIGKKQGKSTLCSLLAVWLMLEAEASQRRTSLVPVVKQSRITFDEARYITEAHPALKGRTKPNISDKRIRDLQGGGKIEVLAATKQINTAGFNASAVIWDEFAAFDNGVAMDAWDQLLYAGMARPAPLSLVLSTAQGDSKHKLAYAEYCRAKAVLAGEDDDLRFLPVVYGMDEGDDWHAEETWHKCCPSIGHACRIETLREMHATALKIPAQQYAFKTLILNSWDEGSPDRWIQARDWEACVSDTDEAELKELCRTGEATAIIGVDLSKTQDLSCSCVLVRHGERYHLCQPRYYIPRALTPKYLKTHKQNYQTHARNGHCELTDGHEGKIVDNDLIGQRLREDCKEWHTDRIAFDPWGATDLMQRLDDEGLSPVRVSQNWGVAGPASSEFERLILGGLLSHPGHPLTDWCVSNCVAKDSPLGDCVRPIKPDKQSGRKIDGIVCAIQALALHMTDEPDATSFCLF